MSELDSILEGKTEEPESKVKETKEPEKETEDQKAESQADDKPEDQADDEKSDDGASEPEPEVVSKEDFDALHKALVATRKSMSEKVGDLEAKLTERAKEPAPDPFDEPEAYQAHQKQELEERLFQDRSNMSYDLMIDRLSDKFDDGEVEFNEKGDAFMEAAKQNPALVGELKSAPNPASFIYKTGKAHLDMQAIGDPEKYGKKMYEEGLAKAREEMKGEIEKLRKEVLGENVPSSLADEKSTGGVKSPGAPTHTPLENLIGRDAGS